MRRHYDPPMVRQEAVSLGVLMASGENETKIISFGVSLVVKPATDIEF